MTAARSSFGGDGSPIGRLVDNIGSRTDGVGNSKRVVRPGTTRTPIIASGTRRRPKSNDEFDNDLSEFLRDDDNDDDITIG